MLARQHNNANVIAMGARLIGIDTAKDCLSTFLATPFEGGRHERRSHQVLARLGPEPRAAASDRDRPRGPGAARAGRARTASALRHGDCDYSFLLFSLDAQTRNSILQIAGQTQEGRSENDDPLTNVLCRITSSKQRALEDEFKATVTGDNWTDILTKAFIRALPCLPFYKATLLECPPRFLAWYVSGDTVILNKSSLVSCLAPAARRPGRSAGRSVP